MAYDSELSLEISLNLEQSDVKKLHHPTEYPTQIRLCSVFWWIMFPEPIAEQISSLTTY